jgi:hypothetical protein
MGVIDMNYLMQGQPFKYVDGECQPRDTVTTRKNKHGKEEIEPYGKLSDQALMEIVCLAMDCHEPILVKFARKELADRLKVNLRKKPMSTKEALDYYEG